MTDRALYTLYLRKFAAFYLGCLFCVLLQQKAAASAVTASAAVGLAATFIPLPKSWDPKGMYAAVYAGTFAGMCSLDLLAGQLPILIISLFGGAIYVLAKPRFIGFGGKLGAIAFVSSLLLLLIRSVQ